MKFLALSRSAADTIASDRFVQSREFPQGLELAQFLNDPALTPPELARIFNHRDKDGTCFVSTGAELPGTLVFDLTQADLFEALATDEALLVFQRILRFALRYWSNQKLNVNERIVKGTSHAVVFPFPISTQSLYRVVIETAPDDKRLARRPHLGKCLLVYAAGTDDKCGSTQDVPVTVFRKAIDAIGEGRRLASEAIKPSSSADSLKAIGLTRLGPLPNLIDGHIGFDAWERNLTSSQRAFVTALLVAPHRIEGPAGSGKTMCLVLRAIQTARSAKNQGQESRSVFLAHSESTRRTIQTLFDANDPDRFASRDFYSSSQLIKVTTLHELCGELLGKEIAESEFLDRDALESKNTQLLYVDEALHEALEVDLETHKRFLSSSFQDFLETEDRWKVSLMLQHEISVVIKGRAQENLDNYKSIPRVPSGLPLSTDADRGFVYIIFQRYQDRLKAAAAFDTDDVVLSALGQLNTPIWRRRRKREGYDNIFVDETHLFNLNELSVLHHLTRTDTSFPIAYAADPSQALEDRGWSDQLFDEALAHASAGTTTTTRIKAVFRCSPDITDLAMSVTASGATLFANFDNPLRGAASAFTEQEERQTAPPLYVECPTDGEMIRTAFQRAECMADSLQGGRSRVAIVVFDDTLFALGRRFAAEAHKPIEVLSQRGDVEVLHRAARAGRFILSTPDYVGGLEFAGVVLVGVDRGRVPPMELLANTGSAAFLSYQAHSRLYVALTRARFRVEILGTAQRGPSDLLKVAFETKAISSVASAA